MIWFVPLIVALGLAAQQPSTTPPAPAAEPGGETLVREWFQRWNALDGSPESVEAWLALYQPDALHFTGPARHQKGTVTFHGHAGLRTLATLTMATIERPAYRIDVETAQEKSAELFHTAVGPWGGPSVAVQFAAVYTLKETGARYVTPGAAFFQITDGKIRRARIYLADDEQAEVEPEPTRRPPL